MNAYNKIIAMSNALYNDGLEKAKVRDLSGAVQSLRKSLRYDKGNIPARNLLGLVYFEMGEAVDALSEWVISRSLQPKGNLAEHYLEEIQSNRSRLSTINQTIKKYNQALQYCYQGSHDLAIIQLKKVLNMNAKLIKGYQLLALLYMEEGKYGHARKELRTAAEIDNGNLLTLRYLREAEQKLGEEAHAGKEGKKDKKKKAMSYQSGNDMIIQPTNVRDFTPLTIIINLAVGVGLGMLITWFLILPAIQQDKVADAKKTEVEASDALVERNQEIKALESKIKGLEDTIEQMKGDSADAQKVVDNYEAFLKVYAAFAQQNILEAGDTMEGIDVNLLGAQGRASYQALKAQVDEQYTEVVYKQAEEDYNAQRYAEAVTGLEKVVAAEEDYNDGYAIYYLANSYRETGDMVNAKKYYQRMVELHPGTQRAGRSQQYLNQMEQEGQP